MEENIIRKIVNLDDLLPFTDDRLSEYNEKEFNELVDRIRIKNHEYGYWVSVRPDPNDSTSGKYEVDLGHGIVRAAEKAGLDSVTAVILPSQEELDSYPLEDDVVTSGACGNFKNLRRVKQDSNVINIELDKLVPFNNCSFEMFRGRRFEEMVDSVRVLGIVRPIIVRPTIGKKYEVLNGYYRAAAAIKLNLKTIPAVVHEGLTDEDALLFVSDTNPIGLLVKYGIDIEASDYKKSKSFLKLQNARIFSDDCFSMALDEYIERHLLSKDEIPNTYESKYDMGNPYELNKNECQYPRLVEEIDRIIGLEYEYQSKNLGKSKTERGISDARTTMDVFDEKELLSVSTFTQPGGYIDQLKSHLNLDFDLFDDLDIQNKREKVKILYFLYMLKNRHFPKVNVLEMLSKPSMENNDNSFFGRETSNGRFIKVIKRSLEKELTLQAKNNIKGALAHVADTWSNLITGTLVNMNRFAMYGYKFDFYDTIGSQGSKHKNQYWCEYLGHLPLSPIAVLYLKVVQYEYLGLLKDILMISDLQKFRRCYTPPEFFEGMRKYRLKRISISDVKSFFSVDTVQEIAPYVFLKSETSKEERRKIRNSREKVLKFLDFCYLTELEVDEDETVSELLLISCLQVIMLDEQNEVFKYVFHGYEGIEGNRKGRIHFQAALKNDRPVYEALQVYWVRRVIERWYSNLDEYDKLRKFRRFEEKCFSMLESILSCSTTDKMLRLNSFYFRGTLLEIR